MIYVNGTFRCDADASVNVFDHGLPYGDGVFEAEPHGLFHDVVSGFRACAKYRVQR